jgi:hypothetical protein
MPKKPPVPNLYTQTAAQRKLQEQSSIYAAHSDTVEPSDRETVAPSEDQVVKTSFYPRQDQLDKLDDLAGEYNKRYRRQRKRIDRQDIIRFLIDGCTLDSLEDLKL